jgi:aminobenzoyl-glutamate transport protein
MSAEVQSNEGRLQKFLHKIEKAGNALPHPAILFLILSAAVIGLSAIVAGLGIEALHPVKKEVIKATNLFSTTGLHLFLNETVKNFSGFAPLGTVLVAMLGFSVAEKSGLISALLRLLVLKSPSALLVPAILLGATLSHTAGDVGYVLLIPLAAAAFHSAGRNPLAGLAICFAGVSGGFAANVLLSTADAMLSSFTNEAARTIDPSYNVTVLSNYYFMAASSLLIVGVGTLVANKVTIPFLGEYTGNLSAEPPSSLSSLEKKGLLSAATMTMTLAALIVWGIYPEDGFLRDPQSDIFHSPALKGVVTLVFVFGVLSGLAYGIVAKTLRSSNDVISAMQEAMVTMAPYLVLVFFASQFIALFNASNVGLILSVYGSEFFKEANIGLVPLMIGFIILTCLLDLVMGSASAKWALMAPVFVPMFMLLGASPELTQAAYRVADSVVNIISPLMSYFPLILAFAIKYDPKARVGTVIAMMLPYSIAFLVGWSLMLFAWMFLGWQLGPGAPLFYDTQSM